MSSQEGVYQVEKILGHKRSHGRLVYLLKWKNWPSESNTWEPEENMAGAQQMLEKYWRKHGRPEQRANWQARHYVQDRITLEQLLINAKEKYAATKGQDKNQWSRSVKAFTNAVNNAPAAAPKQKLPVETPQTAVRSPAQEENQPAEASPYWSPEMTPEWSFQWSPEWEPQWEPEFTFEDSFSFEF